MSRDQKLRTLQKGIHSTHEVVIPDKVYFRIGEVSRLAQTKPYVLRYWETEFPTLRPGKTRTGHRVYRRKDVETVFEIKRLLYNEGFTIDGARKQLAANVKTASAHPQQKHLFQGAPDGAGLRLVERELRNILTMLSRKSTVARDE
ncbi:MAG TPA: MerR family transcriptional regulator [Terriglobia bacterium]|nr:MerR family transcriptional regulator [Terriglobia bacterium]